MSKPDVWMPLYVGDYLADTLHLTCEQNGAYLLLLMHYWRNGPLPENECALATICRVAVAKWRRDIAPSVLPFFTVADGRLHQKRIDKERQEAAEISGKRKAAAEARWAKNASSSGGSEPPPSTSTSNANASANGHAERMLRAGARASASPSHLSLIHI